MQALADQMKDQMKALSDQMTAFKDAVDARMDAMDARMDAVDARMDAAAYNSRARARNNAMGAAFVPLQKEKQPGAGTLPPQNLFPANTTAAFRVRSDGPAGWQCGSGTCLLRHAPSTAALLPSNWPWPARLHCLPACLRRVAAEHQGPQPAGGLL